MKSILPTQQRHLTLATLACISIVTLFILYGYWNIQEDDSYIFYSYAQNLVKGNGYVFNPGERINATTSPLYTILLSLVYMIFRFLPFVTIPLIGHVIGAISLFFLCFFLMQSFMSEKASLYPFVLPLVFLTNPLLARAIGMETFLAMMLALMCLNFYVKGRLTAASLVCSFAVLARPDMILLGVVLLSYHFFRNRRLPSISMVSVFLFPILVWFIFSIVYFGNPLPSTLSAKLAQTKAGLWGPGLVFLKRLLSGTYLVGGKITRNILAAAVVLGLVVLMLRVRQWSVFRHPVFHLILTWNLVYIIVYGFILNTPAYSWYYTPLALGIAVISTLAVEGLYRFLSNTDTVRNRALLPMIYLPLVLVSLMLPIVVSIAPISSEYENYKQAAEWLNANASPGSGVGANDIGILRYFYKKGPIIDGVGLVTPGVADHVRRRDFSWYIHHYRPNYIMFSHPHWPVIERMVEEEWFRKDYILQTIIKTRRQGVAIYKRINDKK
jgi:hypothetical protein